ncbi:hypothetical protein [Photorhabdus cinerea]|uniref:hypothetical protein n=1 Tax=Photorhabdus cinerea TaxID=471575 RepID=UPI0014087914|nr:hypothetical protein [Photorhabdus cinerea]
MMFELCFRMDVVTKKKGVILISKLGPLDCIDSENILKHWIEFQLVDERAGLRKTKIT